MMKQLALTILMAAGLWLVTDMIRNLTVPGISGIENGIYDDMDALKAEHPEMNEVIELELVGSKEGGVSRLWSTEANLNCLKSETGKYGLQVLMLPIEDDGHLHSANVQYYIYDLESGEFVKEIARTYKL